jgi:hypothetical protein
MHRRSLLIGLALSLLACGDIVVPAPDATPDAALVGDAALPGDAAPPVEPAAIQVATNAVLLDTAVYRSPQRIFTATMWGGLASHEHVTVHSVDLQGGDARRVGDFFYRSGLDNILSNAAVATSGDAVAVVLRRGARHRPDMRWGPATNVVVFSANERDRDLVGEYETGSAGLLDGVTEPLFAPSITPTREGWLVLDMVADRRMRLSRVDQAGALQTQRHFELPVSVTMRADIARWAVAAQGEQFIVATDDEASRLLLVSERGIANITERIQAISRVYSQPQLCAGEGEQLEFAQSAENSATLWALHESPSRALRSVALDESRSLGKCARPGLWLRIGAAGPDVWDASAMRARCGDELRAPRESVARTVNVSDSMAIATDVERDVIVLRLIALSTCLGAR